MNPIFNESFLSRFNTYALPVAVIWTLSSAGSMFLSSTPQEGYAQNEEGFFEIFRFGDKFALPKYVRGGKGKTVTKTTLVPSPHQVKAIFRSEEGSFVTIDDGRECLIVPLHGIYKNTFRLVGMNDEAAIFRGHGKNYRIRLGYQDNLETEQSVTLTLDDTNADGEGEWHTITQTRLIEGMNNIKNLLKTISIRDVRSGDKIAGFKVERIASDSVFAQLGVIQGDVIESVNNKKLESYADVLGVYNQVPHMKSICITVVRNNQHKDLLYEITR